MKAVSTSHENNLNVLIIVAGALAWFLSDEVIPGEKMKKILKK